jgi:iron-sulfur cluster assembly protein
MNLLNVTPAALEQIRDSAQKSGIDEVVLRLAAKKSADGSLEYGFGFHQSHDDDIASNFKDILVVVAPDMAPLFKGATLDYVELEPGVFNFIFINPNDANYTPPPQPASSCGSGGCSSCN